MRYFYLKKIFFFFYFFLFPLLVSLGDPTFSPQQCLEAKKFLENDEDLLIESLPPKDPLCRDKFGRSSVVEFLRRGKISCFSHLFRTLKNKILISNNKQFFINQDCLVMLIKSKEQKEKNNNLEFNYFEKNKNNSYSNLTQEEKKKEEKNFLEDFLDDASCFQDPLNSSLFQSMCQSLPQNDCSRWQQCILKNKECCKIQIENSCLQQSSSVPQSFSSSSFSSSSPYFFDFSAYSTLPAYLPSSPVFPLSSSFSSSSSLSLFPSIFKCPSTWDGFSCWNETEEGTDIQIQCPSFIKPTVQSAIALKSCLEGGKWKRKKNSEWTDYTNCFQFHQGYFLSAFFSISINLISILFLSLAIFLFFYFKDLIRQDRVQVHVNFFASLILTNALYIAWISVVHLDYLSSPVSNKLKDHPGREKANKQLLTYQNPVWCRMVNFFNNYFIGTSYAWMFCEGFHLHRLITNAFVPPKSMKLLYGIGWGLPLLTVCIYSIVKIIMDNKKCWLDQDNHYQWILYGPNTLCLVLNFVFLVNILRTLLFQLQSHPNEPNSFRRGLKASLMLVPLFGLHMLATLYRPELEDQDEVTRQIIFDALNYSQGIFVSLVFCFFSKEVLNHLKRDFCSQCWKSKKNKSHMTTMTHTIFSTDEEVGGHNHHPHAHPLHSIDPSGQEENKNINFKQNGNNIELDNLGKSLLSNKI